MISPGRTPWSPEMHIESLSLQNFRCYEELTFRPGQGLNIFSGKNAQGKSSLLEAVYLLATGRSWRAGRDTEMIRWESECARVRGGVARREQNDIEIDVSIGRVEKKQIRVNTVRLTKISELLGQANALFIGPQDLEIAAGEPSVRRRFLNLEISQIQPQYCHLFASYRKVLEQRNTHLRDLSRRRVCDGVLDALDEQLVLYGSQIIERRLAFLERASELARGIHARLTDGGERLEIEYRPSIGRTGGRSQAEISERFAEKLAEVRAEELRRGVTLAGPQRDDMLISANDVDVRTYGSQGQQRTAALSLRLAELEMMEEAAGEPPIVLLDDVMTDLDEERRAHVFEMTVGRCQTLATTASLRFLGEDLVKAGTVFEVAGGGVRDG